MLNLIITIWNKVKNNKNFWFFCTGLGIFLGGYFMGKSYKVPTQIVEHTVEDTVSKQKLVESQKVVSLLQEQLTVAQTQISELKTHVKTVIHIVKQKDGTTVVDKTTESDTDKTTVDKTDVSKTINNTVVASDDKKLQTETTTHKNITKTITPIVKPWFIGPLVTYVPSAPIGQQFVAGIVVGRYLGEIPLLNVPISVAASLSVPVYKPISIPSIGASVTFGF